MDEQKKIREIKENKKLYLDLLLLADEQEDMIDRYLERGTMYVLDDDGVKAECVVTDEGDGILEIKKPCGRTRQSEMRIWKKDDPISYRCLQRMF